MTKIHLAHTSPVNPPGASPVLSHRQVWAGLMRKARRPGDFVPVVEGCEIHSETEDSIVCTVTFKEGVAHARSIKEACKLRPPCRLEYVMEGGSTAVNIISTGTAGKEDDLFLTFLFEWDHPELEEGSGAAEEAEENHRKASP